MLYFLSETYAPLIFQQFLRSDNILKILNCDKKNHFNINPSSFTFCTVSLGGTCTVSLGGTFEKNGRRHRLWLGANLPSLYRCRFQKQAEPKIMKAVNSCVPSIQSDYALLHYFGYRIMTDIQKLKHGGQLYQFSNLLENAPQFCFSMPEKGRGSVALGNSISSRLTLVYSVQLDSPLLLLRSSTSVSISIFLIQMQSTTGKICRL